MNSYKNKSKEELITALEKLMKLNNSLMSSAAKDRIEYDLVTQQNLEKGLQFKKLSENLPALIFQFTRRPDGSYYVPVASEGIKNIFGCSPEDVVDDFTPIAKVIYPEDAEKVTNNIEYSAKYLTNFICEFRVQLPGQEIQWILFKSIPKKLPDGSITWSGFNANITEQKKAEEWLASERRRLSDILKGTNIGTWEWNIQTGETTFNERWAEIIGYTLAEISPTNFETWRQFMHPDDLKKSETLLKKHFKDEVKYYEWEGRMKHKNGSWIWVLGKGSIHFSDKAGNPLYMSGTHQDITKRKKIEAALKKSEERYNLLLNNLNVGVVVHAPDTSIIMNNAKASEMLGLSGAQLQGKRAIDPNWKFLDENYNPLPIEAYPANIIANSKKALTDYIIGNRQPHKNDINWVSVNGFPVFDSAGQLSEIIISFIDITEQKVADEKLKESYALLRLAEQKAKLGGWSVNLEDNICHWSPEVAAIHEMPKDYSPLVSEGIDFYAPEWRDKITEVFNNSAQNGVPFDEEMQIITSKGKRVWVRSIGEAAKNSSGKIVKVQGAFQDISERKKSEEALRESESKLKRILNNLQDAYLQADLNDKITFVNQTAVQKYGYANIEEMIGLSTINLYKDLGERKKLLINLNKSGKLTDIIGEGLKKDGSSFWVSMSVQFIKDNHGEIIGTEGLVRDITDRKKTEDQIRKLSQAVEQSPASIIITDTLGNIEYANPKTLEITGYGLNEIRGKNPNIFSSGEKPKSDYKYLWKTILSGKEWRGEFHNKKKNGNLYWETASISPIKNDKGKIINFLGVKEDITEHKQILNDLIVAKEHAEESDRLKSAFLANMSHEIRTPMNGILGFAGLLKEPGVSGEKQKKYIEIIEKSGERMLNIINDIVDISKIESGLMEVTMNETDINEKIENLFHFFKPEAEAKKIQLSVKNILPKNNAIIKTDVEKVYAIFANLIKNAIKFTHKGEIEFGVVPVKDTTGRAFLKFFIKDSGIGIPKDRQEAIFERFIQADIHDKMALQGAGLGLSISKAYVEMLGGKIWVTSEPGIGSTFYFTIPCNRESENIMLQEDATAPITGKKTRKLKMLIAEDDEASEMLLTIIVEAYASELFIAKNGVEAVEICRNHNDIDLILMDVLMPKLNGYDATRQIRTFNKKVVIIAQTAFAMSQDRQKALDAGCDDHIPKPIRIEDLLELMEKYFK